MALWRRKKKPFDRTAALPPADRARASGRVKKAIAGYQRVLAADPHDVSVHGKLAPLLARRRQKKEAMASFLFAAQGHLKAGFADRALSVYLQASAHYPEESGLWDEIARLNLVRGRRADAVKALVEGGSRLGRGSRPQGMALLRKALEIEPYHVEATLGLARLLGRDGRRREAAAALEDLAGRVRGRARRRVRRALLGISPTPANFWRWLAGR